MTDFESIAKELDHSEGHRVLRRFSVGDSYGEIATEKPGSLCLADFETTGLEETDKPIELGMVRVEYDPESGRLGKILERYSGFEDPGFALPETIVKLTGITDKDVRGQRFDDDAIKGIIERSNIVIAHNASFDRGVGERRFEFMADKAWACSVKDIPWKEFDIGSSKLEFIAFKLGFFYGAHRAVTDSEVTGGMINVVLPDGHTGLWHLLQWARKPQYRVWATGAHYEHRAVLKSRGYEWKDVPGRTDKAWRIETPDFEPELEFLKESVFKRGGCVLKERIGSKNRFTNRRIESDWIDI